MKRTGRLVFVSGYRLRGHGGGIASGRPYYIDLCATFPGSIVSQFHSAASYEEINNSRWISNNEGLLKAFSLVESRVFMSLSERQEVQRLFSDHYSFQEGSEKMKNLLVCLLQEEIP